MIRTELIVGGLVLALAGAACGDDDTAPPMEDGGTPPMRDGNVPEVDGNVPVPDGSTPACPAVGDRTPVSVAADITADTEWTCDNLYTLDTAIYVTGGTLTIRPGTVIQGSAGANALIITTAARIDAQGTAEAPIVFTSAAPEGTREPGNWGGLVMLGLAPINTPGGTNNIEGLEPTEARGQYGGTMAAHDCGTVRYARVEFAGFRFGKDNELNGLTLGGCGSETMIDHVQVHRGLDDGIEFFGGAANLSHAVISQTGDDGLDWDEGSIGKAQFVVCQQDNGGERCVEADNREAMPEQLPRSSPTIYNVTFVGGGQASQQAMRLRRGTAGAIHNLVAINFGMTDCIHVDGTASLLQANAGDLLVSDSVLDGCGMRDGSPSYFRFTADEGDTTTMFTGDWAPINDLGVDPMLQDPMNLDLPVFVPMAASPVAEAGVAPPSDGFFDVTASYAGAFAPGGTDWAAGWTSFPAD